MSNYHTGGDFIIAKQTLTLVVGSVGSDAETAGLFNQGHIGPTYHDGIDRIGALCTDLKNNDRASSPGKEN